MSETLFVTGASGFVGQHLIKELITSSDATVYALVRKRGESSAQSRCDKIFASLSQDQRNRIIPVEGEITEKYFGLIPSEFSKIALSVTSIYHTAATVKFNLPYDEARLINVSGTQNVLDLAQSVGFSQLKRFHHVSTAYVDRSKNTALERLYNNSYEETKFEAEQLVKSVDGLPFTIYRPSIISGNSVTGEIAETSVIFKFMLLLSKHLLHELPSGSDSSLNIIPVNNFIEQMLELGHKEDSLRKAYFVTNHENVSFENLIKYSCELMGVEPPNFLPMNQVQNIPLRVLNQIQTFLPYINQSQIFDLKKTKETLGTNYHSCDNAIKAQEIIVASCLSSRQLIPKVG